MSKITTINISHTGETCDQADIEAAFKWITDQMTAADLANCDHVTVSMRLNEHTRIDFNLYTEQGEGQQS